jgi:hypothetical protein
MLKSPFEREKKKLPLSLGGCPRKNLSPYETKLLANFEVGYPPRLGLAGERLFRDLQKLRCLVKRQKLLRFLLWWHRWPSVLGVASSLATVGKQMIKRYQAFGRN